MTAENVEALNAWVQKVFDLVRDVSREAEGQRNEINRALIELRRTEADAHRDIWNRLDEIGKGLQAVSLELAQKKAQEGVRERDASKRDNRSWQVKLALISAVLALLGNLVSLFKTNEVVKAEVEHQQGAPKQ